MLSRKEKIMAKEKARPLISKVNYRSPVSEQYRSIRTDIQIAAQKGKLRTIVVTSARPSEGKSLTVANLSVTFAQQGKKVLLIDADFRKPTLQYTFLINNEIGLSSILTGESSLKKKLFIQESDVSGLDLLPSGPIPEKPSELASSRMMKEVIDSCAEHYDFVFVDTPPILVVTDAQVLSTICDGALLVARSGKTEVEDVQMAIELLKLSNVSYMGAILNDVKEKPSDYYYTT